MGTTIEEVRSLNDPQRAYKWRIYLPNLSLSALNARVDKFAGSLPGISGTPFDDTIASQSQALINGAKNKLNSSLQFFNPSLQVEEVQGLPFNNIEAEEFYEAGRTTYYPGRESTDPVSIVFFQDASGRIPDYLHKWKRLIINEDGTKNPPANYKFPITVQYLNGKNKVSYEVTLQGCFPTITTSQNLNQESENIKFTQEFSVQKALPTPILDLEAALKGDLQDRVLSKTNEELLRGL